MCDLSKLRFTYTLEKSLSMLAGMISSSLVTNCSHRAHDMQWFSLLTLSDGYRRRLRYAAQWITFEFGGLLPTYSDTSLWIVSCKWMTTRGPVNKALAYSESAHTSTSRGPWAMGPELSWRGKPFVGEGQRVGKGQPLKKPAKFKLIHCATVLKVGTKASVTSRINLLRKRPSRSPSHSL